MMDSMFIDGTSVIICTYPLQDGWTALMKAFDSGHMECVKMLLDRGAHINMPDKVSGVTLRTYNAACTQSPSCE